MPRLSGAFLLTDQQETISFAESYKAKVAKEKYTMIRRMILPLGLAIGLTTIGTSTPVSASGGSAFGSGWTANVIPQGQGQLGGFIGLADFDAFGGSFTYGLSDWANGRVKLSFVDVGDLKLAFGADFQWQFLSVEASKGSDPFDCAVGGLLEIFDANGAVTQFGGFVNGSYPFALKKGTISPYARVDGRIVSFDGGSDLDFGLHAGAEWALPKFGDFWVEFQLDGNDGIFLGVDFDVI